MLGQECTAITSMRHHGAEKKRSCTVKYVWCRLGLQCFRGPWLMVEDSEVAAKVGIEPVCTAVGDFELVIYSVSTGKWGEF